jgi:hypothetical protein
MTGKRKNQESQPFRLSTDASWESHWLSLSSGFRVLNHAGRHMGAVQNKEFNSTPFPSS